MFFQMIYVRFWAEIWGNFTYM